MADPFADRNALDANPFADPSVQGALNGGYNASGGLGGGRAYQEEPSSAKSTKSRFDDDDDDEQDEGIAYSRGAAATGPAARGTGIGWRTSSGGSASSSSARGTCRAGPTTSSGMGATTGLSVSA